jgi:putative transcriptional regulator
VKLYQPHAVDVSNLRQRLSLTQEQFAARFGFSVATLRHWERGDRSPSGASLVLLNVIDRNSTAVLQALQYRSRQPFLVGGFCILKREAFTSC